MRTRRAQRIVLVYAVMACVAMLVGLQFLLLTLAVEGFLGGRRELLVPCALASGACFAASCVLVRRVVSEPAS